MEHRLLRFKGVLLPHRLLLRRMASLTILTEALVVSVSMAAAPKGVSLVAGPNAVLPVNVSQYM